MACSSSEPSVTVGDRPCPCSTVVTTDPARTEHSGACTAWLPPSRFSVVSTVMPRHSSLSSRAEHPKDWWDQTRAASELGE
jgi:hypothetical protein